MQRWQRRNSVARRAAVDLLSGDRRWPSDFLLFQVGPLANQRPQGQCPGQRNGSGVKALFIVARLVVERAGQRHVVFPPKRGLRLRSAFEDYLLYQRNGFWNTGTRSFRGLQK